MKRKADSMLPYLLVAALVAVPLLTGFVHALRTGYGVTDAQVMAKEGTYQYATNPQPVRR